MEPSKWLIYKELELIPDSVKNNRTNKSMMLKSWLHKIWNHAMHILIDSPEPQILEKYDPCGRKYWSAYDPLTHRSLCFASKAEVIDWLEHRQTTADRFYRLDRRYEYLPWR